jgi:hypothetical protein
MRSFASVASERGASARDQDVRSAFDITPDDATAPRAGHLVEGRHELVVRVERQLGDPGIGPPGFLDVQFAFSREHDQGALGRIADEFVPVEHGVGAEDHRQQVRIQVDVRTTDVPDLAICPVSLARDREAVLPRDRQFPSGHLIQRKRAGLVGADHRRRAKCLDRRKALDDRVSAGDLAGTDREERRDDRGESSRYRSDRERHTGDEQRVERLTADQPEQDDQQQCHAGDRGNDLRQTVELFL